MHGSPTVSVSRLSSQPIGEASAGGAATPNESGISTIADASTAMCSTTWARGCSRVEARCA